MKIRIHSAVHFCNSLLNGFCIDGLTEVMILPQLMALKQTNVHALSFQLSLSQLWLNLRICVDPFAEADEDTGETRQSQNYIHIRIQRMLPHKKFWICVIWNRTR